MLISIFHAGHDKRPRVKRRYGSLDRPYEQELVRRCASAGAPPPVRLCRCASAGAPPPLPVRLLRCRCASSAAGASPLPPVRLLQLRRTRCFLFQFNSIPSVVGAPPLSPARLSVERHPPLSSVCPSVDSSALESLQKIDHNRRVNLK